MKACYLCGAPADDKDHVVAKQFFPKPRPTNLITLPTCTRCNRSHADDEELLRAFVVGRGYSHPAARRIWRERIMPSFENKPRFRSSLVAQLRPVDIRSEAGLYLGTADQLRVRKDRVDRVLAKMTRGLYLHHEDRELGDVDFDTYLDPQPNFWDALQKTFRMSIKAELGDGVFTYWRGIAADEPDASVWFFLFYEHAMFVVVTTPRSPAEAAL